MLGDFPYNEDYEMRQSYDSSRDGLGPRSRDAIMKFRNSILDSVLNEINKVHYSRTPVAFTHSELLDILRRLRV